MPLDDGPIEAMNQRNPPVSNRDLLGFKQARRPLRQDSVLPTRCERVGERPCGLSEITASAGQAGGSAPRGVAGVSCQAWSRTTVIRVKVGGPPAGRTGIGRRGGAGGTRTLTSAGKSRVLCLSRSGAAVLSIRRPLHPLPRRRATLTILFERSTSRFVLLVCSFYFEQTIAIE